MKRTIAAVSALAALGLTACSGGAMSESQFRSTLQAAGWTVSDHAYSVAVAACQRHDEQGVRQLAQFAAVGKPNPQAAADSYVSAVMKVC